MAEEEVSAGDSVVGSSGRMVPGSLNLPGHLLMPGGSLLMPEARLRQEGSMDSGVPDGLAGQATGVATTPSSFLLSWLVSGFFALSASLLFFHEEARLPCCSSVGSMAWNLLYLEVILYIFMPMGGR